VVQPQRENQLWQFAVQKEVQVEAEVEGGTATKVAAQEAAPDMDGVAVEEKELGDRDKQEAERE